MSLCERCKSGVTHEGSPKGNWETIGDVRSYVATPTTDYPRDKVVLYLADIFGADLVNAQLLADDFAANGFKTIIPDYLNGDPLPSDALDPDSKYDLQEWLKKHGPEKTRPPLDNVISALKDQGITAFGATGYCLGGRYTFDLAFDDVIKVGVVSHPSLLKIPKDLERYSTTKVPLLINSCTVDTQFPLEASAKADEIFGGGKFAPGYKREYWEGCSHGFAVRGDMSDPKVKAGKEGSFKATVNWFATHLKTFWALRARCILSDCF